MSTSSPRPRPAPLAATTDSAKIFASPAARSPRTTTQWLSVVDAMDIYSSEKRERRRRLEDARSARRRVEAEYRGLRAKTGDGRSQGLSVSIQAAEDRLRRARDSELAAERALKSPSIAGPGAPTIAPLPLSDLNLPPSPSTTSPASLCRSSSLLSARPPRRRTRPHARSLSHSTTATSTSAHPIAVRRPAIPDIIVTSENALPNLEISRELGTVRVRAESEDLPYLKELLRAEARKRGADAVIGVETIAWEREKVLVGVGRAVLLERR